MEKKEDHWQDFNSWRAGPDYSVQNQRDSESSYDLMVHAQQSLGKTQFRWLLLAIKPGHIHFDDFPGRISTNT